MKIVLLLFFPSLIMAQNNKFSPTRANYEKVMAFTNATNEQIDSAINLSIEYSYTNKDSCITLGLHSVEISKNRSDKATHGKALLEMGDTYRIFGNLEDGLKLIEDGKAIYVALSDEKNIAYANNKLGAVFQNKGDYPESIKYYIAAHETAVNLKDTSNIINTATNIGVIFNRLKRRKKAEEYNDISLKLARLRKESRPIMYALNNQALNYQSQYGYYSSLDSEDSLKMAQYQDSSSIYMEKAYESHEESLEIAKALKDNYSIIRSLINLGILNNLKEKYPEAIVFLKEAETMSENLRDNTLRILNKTNLAKAYRKTNQINKAIAYAEEALSDAKINDMEGYIATANEELYMSYKLNKMYDAALKKYEEFQVYSHKNGNAERGKAIAEVEGKFQNAQKQKQILELEKTNTSIERQRNNILGGSIILAVLGFLGFKLRQTRKERNDKKAFAEALINAQEEERKRISRDLHDGVGQSLLLIKKELEKNHEVTKENQTMISDTLEEVRSISRDLHPFQLEKFGITSSILEITSKLEKSTDLFITKEITNIDGLLSPKEEIHVYRTVQEAFNNVLKHSEATAAKITILKENKNVQINIMDNGKGFDYEMEIVMSKSLGLRTMLERITSLGGKMKISNGSNGGTNIEINIPTNRNT